MKKSCEELEKENAELKRKLEERQKVKFNLLKKYYRYLNQQINKFDRLTISALLLTVATIITIINFILIFSGLK